MKILLIHHRLPYPLYSGMDKVRYNLVRLLNTIADVTLIVPVTSFVEKSDINTVSEHCKQLICITVTKIRSARSSPVLYFKRLIFQVLKSEPTYIFNDYIREFHFAIIDHCEKENYDVIHALSDVSSKYLEKIVPSNNYRKVLGPVDDMIGAMKDNLVYITSWKKKLGTLLELKARKHYLPKVCANADKVFFFSEEDALSIQNLAKRPLNYSILTPPVEETDDFIPGVEIENSLIFIGGLGSFFNRNGIEYFIRNILPRILKIIPEAVLYVVGHSPGELIKKYAHNENVKIIGEVPDITPIIQKASVYINPVRTGTGLKTKMIEAFRFGKPVVSTPEGIRGLWEIDKEIVFVEDDPELFAKRCLELLTNPERRKDISIKIRKLYENYYSLQARGWATIIKYQESINS